MTTYRYAAYGSNLHPERLQKRAPSAALVGTALLPGYCLRFHKRSNKDGSGKCNIIAGVSAVYVAVFDLAETDRSELDGIEGLDDGYDCHEVPIDGYGACSIYIAQADAIDNSLVPIDWYKEYVVRGARYHGFPLDYLSVLEQQLAVADADPDRARREWEAVGRL